MERIFHTPEGVRDIYNGECSQKRKVQERIHRVFHQYGYEDIETPTVLKGRVDYFNESKGYGLIKDLGSDEKYFFHVSNNTLTDISETDIVTFELERGLRGMNAINIRIESESSN